MWILSCSIKDLVLEKHLSHFVHLNLSWVDPLMGFQVTWCWEALVTLSALEWLLPWWFPHVPSSGYWEALGTLWAIKKLVSCVAGPLMFLEVEECLRECLQFCQNPFSLSQLRWILQREGSLSVTPLQSSCMHSVSWYFVNLRKGLLTCCLNGSHFTSTMEDEFL